MADIPVKGLAELERQMKAFPVKLQRQMLNRAMAAGARVIAAEIKARAPVKTGAIKRNVVAKRGQARFDPPGTAGRHVIGVRHGKVRSRPTVVRLRTRTKIVKLTRHDLQGQDPFYFKFQELGFHAVGRVPRVKGAWSRAKRRMRVSNARFIPGKRFMQQGFAASSQRAVDRVRQSLAAQIARMQ